MWWPPISIANMMLRSLLCVALVQSGAVAAAGGPGTYAHYAGWNTTTPSNDMQVDHVWTILPNSTETDGNAVFASTQFWSEAGPGGYMGTQVWRDKASGTMVHKAIFSMWDASPSVHTAGVGATCGRFGGEGVGSHCLVDVGLARGKRYTVAVRLAATNASGALWRGTFTDAASGNTTTIGHLFYPNYQGHQGYGGLTINAASFQEYFLSTGCAGQAVSAIGLIGPYFHNRSVTPSQASPDYAGTCLFDDVEGAVPGYGEGRPYVLLSAGGTTRRKTAKNAPLWPSTAATTATNTTRGSKWVSFWYSPSPGDLNETIAKLRAHPGVVTSLMMYCNISVDGRGALVGTVSDSCRTLLPVLRELGIKAEFVVNDGSTNITAHKLFFANAAENIPKLVAIAQKYKLAGWNLDLEPQNPPSKSAADARVYAAYCAKLKAALHAPGVGARLTICGAQWSPMLSAFSVLAPSVDRIQNMETYVADSWDGWLHGDSYGGDYTSFVNPGVPRDKCGVGLGVWPAQCGDHLCWTQQSAAATAQRMDRIGADGVPEVALFRFYGADWPEAAEGWWEALADFARDDDAEADEPTPTPAPTYAPGSCPHSDCPATPMCGPRRCCGDRAYPVLGGVDLVDLYDCNHQRSQPTNCTPRVAPTARHTATLGGGVAPYEFRFLSDTNREAFAANPEKYAPAAGGFCAFSLTGYDGNGEGFWCACNEHEDGYAYVDGALYFFLFSGAKDAFLKHGADAVAGVRNNWPPLLAENGRADGDCFNTRRLVPATQGGGDNDDDPCDMMSCLKFMNCSDCSS